MKYSPPKIYNWEVPAKEIMYDNYRSALKNWSESSSEDLKRVFKVDCVKIE